MGNFVNLTPHALNIRTTDGEMVTIAPSGKVARVGVKRVKVEELQGITIWGVEMGALEGLEGLVGEGSVLITSLAAREPKNQINLDGDLSSLLSTPSRDRLHVARVDS